MAQIKQHFQANKQAQKSNQKIAQWIQNANYRELIDALLPPPATTTSPILNNQKKLSNDQRYALGLALYKTNRLRESIVWWSGLSRYKDQEFEIYLRDLTSRLLKDFAMTLHQNYQGLPVADLSQTWRLDEIRGLHWATKLVDPQNTLLVSLRDRFLSLLWKQGQCIVAENGGKGVARDPLSEAATILQANKKDHSFGPLLQLAQCEFWALVQSPLQEKLLSLYRYLSCAATLAIREKSPDFSKTMGAFFEAFCDWNGSTFGSDFESMRRLVLEQIRIMNQVYQSQNHPQVLIRDGGLFWSPGDWGFIQGPGSRGEAKSFLGFVPPSYRFHYSDVGLSVLLHQAGFAKSISKIDAATLESSQYLDLLQHSESLLDLFHLMPLVAQDSIENLDDLWDRLEPKTTQNHAEISAILNEILRNPSKWGESSNLPILWLRVAQAVSHPLGDAQTSDLIAKLVCSRLEGMMKRRGILPSWMLDAILLLPDGVFRDKFALAALEVSEAIAHFRRDDPFSKKRNSKNGSMPLVTKCFQTCLSLEFIASVSRAEKIQFIRQIQEYIKNCKVPSEWLDIFDEITSTFTDGCDHCFSEFRKKLIQYSKKLNLKLDLYELFEDVHINIAQRTSPTPSNEVVKVQQGKYLSNPFQILEIDTSATKQQILAGVLAQIKKDPQKMAATRQAQASLFDPFSGPVFKFMYQLYAEPQLEYDSKKASTTFH